MGKTKKRWLMMCLAVGLLLLCTACKQPEVNEAIGTSETNDTVQEETASRYSVEQDITFLTEKGNGRLPGSQGNLDAGEYIAQQFQEFHLFPLEGQTSYMIPYVQPVFDSMAPTQTITAVYANGEEHSFVSGTDFYPKALNFEKVTGDVTTDASDAAIKDKIYLGSFETMMEGDEPLLWIYPKEEANSDMTAPMNRMRITKKVYDQLLTAESITVDNQLVLTEQEINNVVGVLKGKDKHKALILGAHFDHIGSYGTTVYKGAVDNASGTAMLLEMMRTLRENKEVLPFDVVFCAFNGEESGILGSQALAGQMWPYDEMLMINLDCVGLKGTSGVLLTPGSELLAQECGKVFQKQGWDYRVEAVNSDHIRFSAAGIPAISIMADCDLTSGIHIPDDTKEQLDMALIEKLAYDTVVMIQEIPFSDIVEKEMKSKEQSEEEYYAMMTAKSQEKLEKYQPERTQGVLFKVDENDEYWYCARDVSSIENRQEAQTLFPFLNIPETIGEYEFQECYPDELYKDKHSRNVFWIPLFPEEMQKKNIEPEEGVINWPRGDWLQDEYIIIVSAKYINSAEEAIILSCYKSPVDKTVYPREIIIGDKTFYADLNTVVYPFEEDKIFILQNLPGEDEQCSPEELAEMLAQVLN